LTELKAAHAAKDSAAVDAAMEKLNSAWTAASEEMYKNASAADAGPQANAGQEQSNSGEATDVDFEEVKEDKR
jgi:molecular chaperone DnaK